MQTATSNIYDKLLSGRKVVTNMQVADAIAQQLPANPSPYFNADIHNYLLSKGAKFQDCGNGKSKYFFCINDEQVQLVFRPDVEGELIFIMYLFEQDDEEVGYTRSWLIDHRFTNPGTLEKFKTILNTYLNQAY